jgi:hypothetical protein
MLVVLGDGAPLAQVDAHQSAKSRPRRSTTHLSPWLTQANGVTTWQGDIEPTTEVNCAPDGRARPSWQECIAEVESEAEEEDTRPAEPFALVPEVYMPPEQKAALGPALHAMAAGGHWKLSKGKAGANPGK